VVGIDVEVIYQLAEAFHVHADTFDALYQQQIPQESR